MTIVWDDRLIEKQWLQVTVNATGNTGLVEPDVFYFGNAVGEAGDWAINSIVNATDEIVARNFSHGPHDRATVEDPYDYNRDALVDGTDQIIARENQTNPLTMLRLITVPGGGTVARQVSLTASADLEAISPDVDWLREFESMNVRNRPLKRHTAIESAVDALLATYWPHAIDVLNPVWLDSTTYRCRDSCTHEISSFG